MVLRPIITWIEVIMGVGLGALIASRLPIPMELDAKDTKKEFKRVVVKILAKTATTVQFNSALFFFQQIVKHSLIIQSTLTRTQYIFSFVHSCACDAVRPFKFFLVNAEKKLQQTKLKSQHN